MGFENKAGKKAKDFIGSLAIAGHGSRMDTNDWKPPLQQHADDDGKVKFVTIKVRVFSCEGEQDILAKFPSGPLYAEKVV